MNALTPDTIPYHKNPYILSIFRKDNAGHPTLVIETDLGGRDIESHYMSVLAELSKIEKKVKREYGDFETIDIRIA